MPGTIKEIYRLKEKQPCSILSLEETDKKSIFGKFTTPIGIEIEAEEVSHSNYFFEYWNIKPDGSLKNDGAEFVSGLLIGRQIDYALKEISPLLPEFNFSHRTSVHVHIGVGDFSFDFIKYLVKVYQTVESIFFSYVDKKRAGNTYCFPLNDLKNKTGYFKSENKVKYAALNANSSLQAHNTIEFRHMHGTSSIVEIKRWIYILLTFFTNTRNMYMRREKIPIILTEEEYRAWLRKVFSDSLRYLEVNLKEDDYMFDLFAAWT